MCGGRRFSWVSGDSAVLELFRVGEGFTSTKNCWEWWGLVLKVKFVSSGLSPLINKDEVLSVWKESLSLKALPTLTSYSFDLSDI
jgi:hypothetical protein